VDSKHSNRPSDLASLWHRSCFWNIHMSALASLSKLIVSGNYEVGRCF
jgi:hypothetical protein